MKEKTKRALGALLDFFRLDETPDPRTRYTTPEYAAQLAQQKKWRADTWRRLTFRRAQP